MLQLSKFSLLGISLLLVGLVLAWPYVTNHKHYDIQEVSAASPEIKVQAQPVPEEIPVESRENKRAPAQDLKDGAMLFQGKTQVIICPENE